MKIKSRLEISAIFFICVILAVGLTLFFMSQQVSEASGLRSVADEIVESTFELNMLTGDYLLHQRERAQSQWYLRHDALTNHLTELEFKNPEEQAILERIRQNHEHAKDVFSQLVARYEGQEISAEESSLREMLATQLSVNLQDMASDASLLSVTAQENLATAMQTSSLLVTVFAITIAVVLGINSVLTINSIAKPIARLHEGVEIIGSGNLDHKVGTSAEDEIGQLSRAFDQMTGDLKAHTEKLKAHSETLEEMVKQRTKELRDAQEELVRKEKLAVLGELAGGVAHDLRNPLGAISNSTYFINMKLKDIADEKVKKHLKIIEREISYSDQIISALLDFTQENPPTLKETNLNDIVTDALSYVPIPENIEVTAKLDDISPMLLDQEQIRRAFQNLILNAIQAMPEGGRLTIQTTKQDDSVDVLFKDTGLGIPKENLTILNITLA